MTEEEIIIEYKQHPDGTYSRSIGVNPDSYAFVAHEMLASAYNQVKDALNSKAVEDGFKDLSDAGKDWAFEQKFSDLKGFAWKGDDDEG